ncbi:hypothetical protein RND81_11G115600 [Saponaria officinalis]|uniref:Uncharacterized protein n=1 Tax=Saponaria officinalis TaxID=3572 RepID=A0AAW1HKN3_SAPOF
MIDEMTDDSSSAGFKDNMKTREGSEDVVSGFLYDRLQKEVISLRMTCQVKDDGLSAKDDEIKVIAIRKPAQSSKWKNGWQQSGLEIKKKSNMLLYARYDNKEICGEKGRSSAQEGGLGVVVLLRGRGFLSRSEEEQKTRLKKASLFMKDGVKMMHLKMSMVGTLKGTKPIQAGKGNRDDVLLVS